jgi:hypothetical protein
MDEFTRLEFLARHYKRLQGLKFAPLYLFFIASPWMDFNRIDLLKAGLAVCFFVVWFLAVKQYYKRRYGQIQESCERRDGSIVGLLPYLGLGLCGVYFLIVRNQFSVYGLLLGNVGALLSEGLHYSKFTLRRAYYIAAALFSFATVLSAVVEGAPGHQFFQTYEFTFLGATLLLLSILDHLLLVYAFQQPSRTIHA